MIYNNSNVIRNFKLENKGTISFYIVTRTWKTRDSYWLEVCHQRLTTGMSEVQWVRQHHTRRTTRQVSWGNRSWHPGNPGRSLYELIRRSCWPTPGMDSVCWLFFQPEQERPTSSWNTCRYLVGNTVKHVSFVCMFVRIVSKLPIMFATHAFLNKGK